MKIIMHPNNLHFQFADSEVKEVLHIGLNSLATAFKILLLTQFLRII
jgi:hypothetical protein